MPGFSSIQVVFFDIGGTLFDFLDAPESMKQFAAGAANAHAFLHAANRPVPALARYRFALQWRLLRAFLRTRLLRREIDTMSELARAHAHLGMPLSETDLIEIGRLVYAPTHAIAHVHPQTPGTLAALRDRGYRLGIISNTIAPPAGLDAHLAAEGLLDLLPVRIYSCVVGVPKPNPRIFAAALAALPAPPPPHRVLYVGNKPRIDTAGARRAGMHTVLRVPPGSRQPRGPAADADIREIHDLLDLLPERPQP